MKTKSMYSYILLAGLMMFAFSVSQSYGQTGTDTQTSTKYVCTMHPEVSKDRPGNCPKCGMKLTAQKSDKKSVSGTSQSGTYQPGSSQSGTFQSGSSLSGDTTKAKQHDDSKRIGTSDSSTIRSNQRMSDTTSFRRINQSGGDM